MTLGIARLIRRKTGDGSLELHEDVPVGKIYTVDLDSIATAVVFNPMSREFWEGEIIDEYPKRGWLPLELLHLELPS